MNVFLPLSVLSSHLLSAQAFSKAILRAQPEAARALAHEMSATLFRAGFDEGLVEQLQEKGLAIEDARQIAGNEKARAAQIELAKMIKAEGQSKRWPGCARILLAQRASELVEVGDEAAYKKLAALLDERAVIDILTAKLEDVTDGAFKDLTPEEDLVMRLLHGIPLNREGKGPGNFDEVEISDLLGMSSEKVRTIKDGALEKIDSSVIEALVARIAPQFRISTEEGRAFYRISRKYSRSLKQFLLEEYFKLRGVSEAVAEKFIEDHKLYKGMELRDSVVSLETGVSIPRLKWHLFQKDPDRYIKHFVRDAKIRNQLRLAIRRREAESNELSYFMACLNPKFFLRASLPTYLSHGCPLDVELFEVFLEDCEKQGFRSVLKTHQGIKTAFEGGGGFEWDLTGQFSLFATLFYLAQKGQVRGNSETLLEVRSFYEFLARRGLKTYQLDVAKLFKITRGFTEGMGILYHSLDDSELPFERLVDFGVISSQNFFKELSEAYVFSNVKSNEARWNVYRQAVKKGYSFEEALRFCFASPDPLAAAQKIEEAINRFQKGNVPIQKLGDLEEHEKIALYAIFVKNLRLMGYTVLHHFPTYHLFINYYLKIAEVLNESAIEATAKRHSPFLRLSIKQYENLPDYDDMLPIVKLPFTSFFSAYDVLVLMQRISNNFGLGISFLMRAQEILKQSTKRAIESFCYFLPYASFSEQLWAIMELLEAGVEQWQVYNHILQSRDPERAATDYLKALQSFKGQGTIGVGEEFSETDLLALYSIVYHRLTPSPNYWTFYLFLEFQNYAELEIRLARKSGKDLSLDAFVERLRFHKVVTDKSASGTNFATPYSIIRKLLALPWITAEMLGRICKVLVISRLESIFSFSKNLEVVTTSAALEAAVELLEGHLPIHGLLFEEYASFTPFQRKVMLAKMRKRAYRLSLADGPESLEKLEDVMALLHFLDHPRLDIEHLQKIWDTMEAVPLDSSVNITETGFSISTVLLPQDIHHTVNKKKLLELAEEVRELATKAGISKVLRAVSGRMPPGEQLKIQALLSEEDEKSFEEKLSISISDLIQKHGRQLPKGELRSLLIALVWRSEDAKDLRQDVLNYRDVKEEGRTIKRALDALKVFYELITKVADQYGVSLLKKGEKALRAAEFLKEEKENVDAKIDKRKRPVTLQLTPSRRKMDALYPFVARNSLADEDSFSIHALAQKEFLPFRITLNGKWIGVVQTYTIERRVRGSEMEKKKILILTGIDPSPDWVFEPESFVKGVLQGFQELARRQGYDLVVVPAVEGMMSSRRTSLVPEIKRHRKHLIQVTKPFGFPRKGPGDYPTSFYKGRKQWEFYVVEDLHDARQVI